MAGAEELVWEQRAFVATDLDDTWYAVAATDDVAVNEQVSVAAEERRVFCVRADDATRATAWTPASGRAAGVTVAVLANREPRRTAAIRDAVLESLREGTLGSADRREFASLTLP